MVGLSDIIMLSNGQRTIALRIGMVAAGRSSFSRCLYIVSMMVIVRAEKAHNMTVGFAVLVMNVVLLVAGCIVGLGGSAFLLFRLHVLLSGELGDLGGSLNLCGRSSLLSGSFLGGFLEDSALLSVCMEDGFGR